MERLTEHVAEGSLSHNMQLSWKPCPGAPGLHSPAMCDGRELKGFWVITFLCTACLTATCQDCGLA